jgi:coenzyme PQQ precursor peptide PqqA
LCAWKKSTEQGRLRRGQSLFRLLPNKHKGHDMAWTTPTLIEICIGLEINGYLPAEF